VNVRIRGSEADARAIAESRNGGRRVHIRSVFFVRDASGAITGERDFVFTTTLGTVN
jgi:hypothetical protein